MNSKKEPGEREIIDLLFKSFCEMPHMPIPFGDDVSAVKLDCDKLAVLKTDMLVGKTDVPPGMTLWQASRKAVVMNISDLAAKGVQPLALLISLGIPRGFTAEMVKQIGKGLDAGARQYGAYIIGGDTNESSDLIISCAAFGVINKDKIITRQGARPGDLVAVTGLFGKTTCGLKILLEKSCSPTSHEKILLNSILMPNARLDEGLALARSETATASIDSSDGLAWSLHEIARASNVGMNITKLPIAAEAENYAVKHGLSLLETTFFGGEEYELIVTIKADSWDQAENAVKEAGGALIKIGRVTKDVAVSINVKGKNVPIRPEGWEHFKKPLR